MKRFLVFGGWTYYPGGGWDDFVGDFENVEDAIAATKDPSSRNDWWHIIDSETKQEVAFE